MFKGDHDLSRARGAKATRRLQQQAAIENTISFNQPNRYHPKQIELVPKSRGQEQLVLSLLDSNTHITVAVGPAGTGKTYLTMQAAIRALRQNKIDRIILTRPAVGVEDEQHGFLPGDIMSKMEPWTRPLLDVLREYYSPREIGKMIEDQIVEISPLAYMRGRTFRNAWIIADEMQNATPNQMKMLLTRIGQGSRITVTGDIEQADRRQKDNGLLDLSDKLARQTIAGLDVIRLTGRDIQRHAMISEILALYP
jgi:phosphate starvation-inducible protein PhoH and related proteins